MSLRAFHLFFIGISVVLAAFFRGVGGRSVFGRQSSDLHRRRRPVAVQRRRARGVRGEVSAQNQGVDMMTRLRLLVLSCLVLAAPRAALACPVCFGQNDSPMAIATNMGIIAMLVVVAGVLGAFASFFIYLMRRAKIVAAQEASEGTAQ
jgi:hypothetical protein